MLTTYTTGYWNQTRGLSCKPLKIHMSKTGAFQPNFQAGLSNVEFSSSTVNCRGHVHLTFSCTFMTQASSRKSRFLSEGLTQSAGVVLTWHFILYKLSVYWTSALPWTRLTNSGTRATQPARTQTSSVWQITHTMNTSHFHHNSRVQEGDPRHEVIPWHLWPQDCKDQRTLMLRREGPFPVLACQICQANYKLVVHMTPLQSPPYMPSQTIGLSGPLLSVSTHLWAHWITATVATDNGKFILTIPQPLWTAQPTRHRVESIFQLFLTPKRTTETAVGSRRERGFQTLKLNYTRVNSIHRKYFIIISLP